MSTTHLKSMYTIVLSPYVLELCIILIVIFKKDKQKEQQE